MWLGLYKTYSNRPPLWSRGNVLAYRPADPGSFPVGSVPWLRFYRGFSSTVRRMSKKSRPHLSPDIIMHYNHEKLFLIRVRTATVFGFRLHDHVE